MILPCLLLLYGVRVGISMPFDYYGMFIEQMLADQLSEIVKNNKTSITVHMSTQSPTSLPLGHPILKEIIVQQG